MTIFEISVFKQVKYLYFLTKYKTYFKGAEMDHIIKKARDGDAL